MGHRLVLLGSKFTTWFGNPETDGNRRLFVTDGAWWLLLHVALRQRPHTLTGLPGAEVSKLTMQAVTPGKSDCVTSAVNWALVAICEIMLLNRAASIGFSFNGEPVRLSFLSQLLLLLTSHDEGTRPLLLILATTNLLDQYCRAASSAKH